MYLNPKRCKLKVKIRNRDILLNPFKDDQMFVVGPRLMFYNPLEIIFVLKIKEECVITHFLNLEIIRASPSDVLNVPNAKYLAHLVHQTPKTPFIRCAKSHKICHMWIVPVRTKNGIWVNNFLFSFLSPLSSLYSFLFSLTSVLSHRFPLFSATDSLCSLFSL